MSRAVLLLLAMVLVNSGSLLSIADDAPRGYRGRVFLRDGTSVEFLYIGELGRTCPLVIRGRLHGHDVRYELGDLNSVVLADATKYYNRETRGDAMIVSREGKRFTITEASLGATGPTADFGATIPYVYQDPVTNRPQQTRQMNLREVSHITVGESRGEHKRNPDTDERFPAFYEYDPFTGKRLEWAGPTTRGKGRSDADGSGRPGDHR